MKDRFSSRGRQRRSKKHRRQKARERRTNSKRKRSKRSLVSHNDLNEMLNELKCRRAERKRVQRERRQNLSEAGSETHYCTGTLLNEKWVITAANCFDVSLFLLRIFQSHPLFLRISDKPVSSLFLETTQVVSTYREEKSPK